MDVGLLGMEGGYFVIFDWWDSPNFYWLLFLFTDDEDEKAGDIFGVDTFWIAFWAEFEFEMFGFSAFVNPLVLIIFTDFWLDV